MTRDRVFRDRQSQLVDFVFDENVARVFPDMIRRSVPGYEVVIPLSGLLVARQLPHTTIRRVYDLGCSLGATTLALLHAWDGEVAEHPESSASRADIEIVAVDNSQPMIDKASSAIADDRVSFVCADITGYELQPCAGVVLNYVLQFLEPAARLHLLTRIRAQLDPGGLLIVSEKIGFAEPDQQAYYDAAHLDFKRANGYSELEIAQKRNALENVMRIDTVESHLSRFHAAGFSSAEQWFGCLNWASFLVRA